MIPFMTNMRSCYLEDRFSFKNLQLIIAEASGCRESRQPDFLFQSRKVRQNEMKIVTMEEFVPENHLSPYVGGCQRAGSLELGLMREKDL
ncbi:hypothetical protein MUN89_10670 [Halobacillus salinarum]|uniref:Uncharacterized protein n=1 Tax=Halobacillus salinarum TaxID=2932257 RepID=A0ABY4EQ54_9BACI|nr:hypothetical protein [Halobacillus salinarum]UOQ46567.1 hypothetical protein MUN89_10670 [Halobacillus salinarum]